MGMKYRDPNTGQLKELSLKAADTLPIGAVIAYSGSNEPSGWLICDGRAISRTNYSNLFNVIGTTYGAGDGSTTFNLPDYRDKVPVGLDSNDSDFDTLGKTGGEKTHTLTVSEIPSHNHAITTFRQYQDGASTDSTKIGRTIPAADGGDVSSITSNQTGGGQAHNNLQPYIVTNYIIKAEKSVGVLGKILNIFSNSDKDTYSCDYVNKALIKNYATFRLNSNINSGDNPIKFDIVSNISDNSIFELQSDGKIKINKKCTLEVNANIRYGYSNPATKMPILYLNDTLLVKGSMQNATATTIGLTPILIDVNANDLLYVIASSSESCAIIHECTYLTIKEV